MRVRFCLMLSLLLLAGAAAKQEGIAEKIIAFCQQHKGEMVGDGECASLVNHALREAGATVGNHRLGECELFVTIEPCAMCAGALVHARIRRLVYGADDAKAGAVHSVMRVINHPELNHAMQVRAGVLSGRSAELLQTFFKSRR